MVAFVSPYPSSKSHDVLQDSAGMAVQLSDLRFAWRPEDNPILEIHDLKIPRGQRVFMAGPSGCGKSTLLGLLAGIAKPQTGSVRVLGNRLEQMNGAARDRFRADHMGVIFQMFNLIPYLTVVENVTLPCRFSRRRYERANTNGGLMVEAVRLLSRLGISDPLLHRPVTELSVGQQQRVAAARALIGEPEILIADEPTSSLDADLREEFIRLLFEACRRKPTTLIFVSHDKSLASLFDHTLRLPEVNLAGTAAADHAKETS